MEMFDNLIDTAELALHLSDPDWIVFDCRFDLMKPDWGSEEYAKAHIPEAIYAHLNHELSGPVTLSTGRHPLPDPEVFVPRLSAWGVTSGKQVVVYDSAGRIRFTLMVDAPLLRSSRCRRAQRWLREVDRRKPSRAPGNRIRSPN